MKWQVWEHTVTAAKILVIEPHSIIKLLVYIFYMQRNIKLGCSKITSVHSIHSFKNNFHQF